MKTSSIAFTGLVASGLLWAAPAQAEWVSPDGDLTLRWLGPLTTENCSTSEPHGNYQVSNIVGGLLYPADCSAAALRTNNGRYRFVDTSGTKRCVGRMHIFFLGQQRGRPTAEATWYIDGGAPGYQCSTSGNIDTTELFWQE